MPDQPVLPSSRQRVLSFRNGTAIGSSHRWDGGQYCSILTQAGIVGCGVYGMQVPSEFGQAIAIARGTPAKPLVEPEDLLAAKIVDCTPRAKELGVVSGMTGREAVERMLAAAPVSHSSAESSPTLRVKQIDHVTFVCQDLERSRAFYGGLLGMMEVARPNFSFAGLWFQAGATQIHLIGQHDLSGPAQTTIAADAAISRTRHVAFEVDDTQAAVRLLEARGIAIVSGPKSRPDGPTQLYILDPDGNLIEIFAAAH